MKDIKSTFSYRVKSEIAAGITGRKKCDACLLGILLYAYTLEPNEIVFRTENDVVKDLFVRLVCHACESDKATTVTEIARKNRPVLYSIAIDRPSMCRKLYERVKINADNPSRRYADNTLPKEKEMGAFVSGIYLACGSVNSPEKGYHLEFVMNDIRLQNDLALFLIDRFGLQGKYSQRGASHVMYFKGSEQVEDVLTFVGAPMSSLELMNEEILKNIRNHVNRAANCAAGNAKKQSATAQRQIEAIEIIDASEGGIASLPDDLRFLAELRVENPDMTLSELAESFDPPLTKSGVNHRLARLEAIAKELSTRHTEE